MFPMKLIVQKFGGTSVANTSSLKIVAERIIDRKKEGYEVDRKSLKIKDKKSRIIGLDGDGGLSTLIEGKKSQNQSIDELTWLF